MGVEPSIPSHLANPCWKSIFGMHKLKLFVDYKAYASHTYMSCLTRSLLSLSCHVYLIHVVLYLWKSMLLLNGLKERKGKHTMHPYPSLTHLFLKLSESSRERFLLLFALTLLIGITLMVFSCTKDESMFPLITLFIVLFLSIATIMNLNTLQIELMVGIHMYLGDLLCILLYHCCSVIGEPTSLKIQPPWQMHLVYTPISGFCKGGHFFNLDSAHLTELSKWVDTFKAKYITNQEHCGTLGTTLCHFYWPSTFYLKVGVNNLYVNFFLSPSPITELFEKSLISLCSMIMFSKLYTAKQILPLTYKMVLSMEKKLIITYINLKESYLEYMMTTGNEIYVYSQQDEVFLYNYYQGWDSLT
jgi:hypothetical protein